MPNPQSPLCVPRPDLRRTGAALWPFLLLATLLTLVSPAAEAARRVAFVVGNASYENEARLANPHNDARLLAGVLRSDLKFDEVIERRDLTRRQLVNLVSEIQRRSTGADAVFVYFSGHGMQGPEGNYLIPVDARIEEEDHVRSESVNARDIVNALRAANPRVAVLVLDACRDSPYSRRTRSATKGLSRMNISGGNLLVAYATTEGTTADDGELGNSPYARALAQHLRDTTQPLLQQFDGVRRTTLQLTGNRQSPTREGDLEVGVHLTAVPAPQAVPVIVDRIENETWADAQDVNTVTAYRAYLDTFPQGRYAARARIAIERLSRLPAMSEAPSRPSQPSTVPTVKPQPQPQPQPSTARAPVVSPVPASPGAAAHSLMPVPGRTYTYRITDLGFGRERTVKHRVDSVTSDRVVFDGGARVEDLTGKLISGQPWGSEHFEPREPAAGWLGQELQAKGTLRLEWTDKNSGQLVMTARIAGRHSHIVAGSAREVLVVQYVGQAKPHIGFASYPITAAYTIWIDAESGRTVRFESKWNTPYEPARRTFSNEVIELVQVEY